jgi:hypothetical protein
LKNYEKISSDTVQSPPPSLFGESRLFSLYFFLNPSMQNRKDLRLSRSLFSEKASKKAKKSIFFHLNHIFLSKQIAFQPLM